jgi:hypothetical protein
MGITPAQPAASGIAAVGRLTSSTFDPAVVARIKQAVAGTKT